jgi:putative membrane-bound dehydrogenase-like protein
MKAPWLAFAFAALAISLHAAIAPIAAAAEQPAVRSPLSPQESLEHFVVAPGLVIELAAHEPNVIDPIAIRFDELSRMWVVEMRDYPTGIPGKKGGSRISILEDQDADGFYEAAVVFAEDLPFATGLQPWKGGVFVTMAGRVAYMKDTTGDGKADVNETWYTGFAEGNTQLRANHPTLALDNHIYIANGLRGGKIVDAGRPNAEPVSISGMDFRFDPLTRKFEAVSGMGQFGLAFDDYGNRFVCSNRNPAIHIVLEDRYLKRNPLVAVDAVAHDVAKAGDESRVFSITRAWTTSNLHAGQFTAACGLKIYRGDALPAEFYGNIFVCEPTGHLVHREIMKPHGVTFTSEPAPPRNGEGNGGHAEFLASRDEWFSPVNLETGPDGALYIVDMYRAVIEHPEWMPEELRKRPDLLWGNDRGRIYRLVPQNFRRPPAPLLSVKSSKQLVEYLAHPNAWWRETAARLLLERQDKTVAVPLRTIATSDSSLLARIHALRLLEALAPTDDELLLGLLDDPNARFIEQAILAAEGRGLDKLRSRISTLAANSDARVRFQALLTARPSPMPPEFPADEWELDAMLVAAGDRGGSVLGTMLLAAGDRQSLSTNVKEPKQFIAALARLAAASNDVRQWRKAVHMLLASWQNKEYARAGLIGFLSEITRGGGSLDDVKVKLKPLRGRSRHAYDVSPEIAQRLPDRLERAFAEAAADATDTKQQEAVRIEAVRLLAYWPKATLTLNRLALEDTSQAVRLRSIESLARQQALEPWKGLLDRFSRETPALQRAILDGVLANSHRIALFLDELAAGRIASTALDANRINLLLNHHDDAIRERAQTLLAEAVPTDRREALAKYQSALALAADSIRGRAVFQKQCASCHHIAGIGVDVAPDISDSRERSPEQLLTDIIQPNRAIDSNYLSYTAVAADGRAYTGILTAETSTSVTLKLAEGKTVTLRRAEIEELQSDGVSLMPDGLEKLISPQDMADLISFIKNWRYLDERAAPLLPRDAQRTERPSGED